MDYLDENGLLPRGGESWAKKIKDSGNEANHELPESTESQAFMLLRLLQQILENLYEIPAELKVHDASKSPPE